MGQYLKKKKTKGKLQRSLLILGEMRTNPSMEPGLGEKNMEKNRKQAKNMLATTVLILNECLLAGKFLVLFGIIIITYFSTLF